MFKNGLYNLAGAVVRLFLSVFTVPILLYFLGATQYGLYSVLFSVVGFVSLFEGSVSVMVTVFVAKSLSSDFLSDRSAKDNILKVILFCVFILCIITTTFLMVGAPFLASWLGNLSISEKETVIFSLRISSIIIITRLAQQFFIGLEQGYGAFKLSNGITTIYNICLALAMLISVYFYRSIITLFIIQGVIGTVSVVVHIHYCLQRSYLLDLNFNTNIDQQQAKHILLYGFKTYMGTVGSALFSQGDRIVVGKVLGLEIAGIYSALTGIAMQINMLSAVPVQPLVQELSSASIAKSKEGNLVQAIFLKSVFFNSLVAAGLGSTVILVAPELVQILFRDGFKKYPEMGLYLQILAVIYTIYSLNATGFYALLAIRREGMNTIISLFCGIFTLLLIAFGGGKYGIYGALIGNAGYITTLLLLIISVWLLKIPVLKTIYSLSIYLLVLILSVSAAVLFNSFMVRFLCALLIMGSLLFAFLQKNKLLNVSPVKSDTL